MYFAQDPPLSYLTHISIEDIKTHTISNFTPIIILLASPFLSWISFKDRIIGLLVVFFVLLAANLIANIGMGDVKLCAALAFVIGAIPELMAILLALAAAKIIGKNKNQIGNRNSHRCFRCSSSGALS